MHSRQPGAAGGGERNLAWLRDFGSFDFREGDIRDQSTVESLFREFLPDKVIHVAGQVAVTTSVANPREDFESNCLGTFNLLEAVRRFSPESVLLYASTNKVYGALDEMTVKEIGSRYAYTALPYGVAENQPLSFHSPYGCSKGAADQYVLDYGRIYGLRTIVLRQSCIYGHRQFGMEEQGWIAWFIIAAVMGWPITIYGDGKQVRDVLFIDDLIDCYEKSMDWATQGGSEVFNVGGGPGNKLSLLELVAMLRNEYGLDLVVSERAWRPGDQQVYISDIRKVERVLGWKPATDVHTGIGKLVRWVEGHTDLFA